MLLYDGYKTNKNIYKRHLNYIECVLYIFYI